MKTLESKTAMENWEDVLLIEKMSSLEDIFRDPFVFERSNLSEIRINS
jgi:hypothetical protein